MEEACSVLHVENRRLEQIIQLLVEIRVIPKKTNTDYCNVTVKTGTLIYYALYLQVVLMYKDKKAVQGQQADCTTY